jgi:guanylate kinase
MEKLKLIGKIIVVSGPSGSGKTTVCLELVKNIKNAKFSISATTRPKRPEEIEGENYHFVNKFEFEKMIENNELIEWERVHGDYYGTPKKEFISLNKKGSNIILDIDPKGALNIKKEFPESIIVFIMHPSEEELYKRLRKRKTEEESAIRKRLERLPMEIEMAKKFDFIVKNLEIDNTVKKIVEFLTGK